VKAQNSTCFEGLFYQHKIPMNSAERTPESYYLNSTGLRNSLYKFIYVNKKLNATE